MKTPVYDYLVSYSKSKMLRMHMPGHKGRRFESELSEIYRFDITEITGAGNLFEDSGIIADSEKNASVLFGTKATFYSVHGSTLCIQTMLAMMKYENRTVIAVRNSHRAFLSACTLLDIDPIWVFPEYTDTIISGRTRLSDVEKVLRENPHACLYITSPDYLGAMADIKSLAELCHNYGAVLLVDNAHGACLPFYSKNLHPIALGADICCDSAHKMLPALTGAAYLHVANERYIPLVKEMMLLFASTSPSYLITCSLDLCNRYIDEHIRADLEASEKSIKELTDRLSEKYCFEYPAFEREPLHFTINASKSGVSGRYLAQKLRENGTEYEFADNTYVVMLFSPVDTKDTYIKLTRILEGIEFEAEPVPYKKIYFPKPKKIMTVREAALSPHEEIPIDFAEGRICANINVPCPPAVPVIVSGELVSQESIAVMKSFGINTIKVVTENQKRK